MTASHSSPRASGSSRRSARAERSPLEVVIEPEDAPADDDEALEDAVAVEEAVVEDGDARLVERKVGAVEEDDRVARVRAHPACEYTEARGPLDSSDNRSRAASARLKAVVVTGASSGIGAGIAETMADAGATVAVVGRDPKRLGRTATALDAHGARRRVIAVDLTDEAAPRRIVEETVRELGSRDILVHSAGVFWPQPFAETPLESLDRQWAINVRAPFALTQAALPHLSPEGVVIFVSSIAATSGSLTRRPNCATKGAVELMTRALANELAAGARDRPGRRLPGLLGGELRTWSEPPDRRRLDGALAPGERGGSDWERVDRL